MEQEKELKYKIVSKVGFQLNSIKKVTGDEVLLKPSFADEMVKKNSNLSLQLIETKPVKEKTV